MADRIQDLRDFQRPFLTMLFSTSFVICVMTIIIGIVLKSDSPKLDQVLAVLGLLGTPLGGMLGYHFAKSTKKDSVK